MKLFVSAYCKNVLKSHYWSFLLYFLFFEAIGILYTNEVYGFYFLQEWLLKNVKFLRSNWNTYKETLSTVNEKKNSTKYFTMVKNNSSKSLTFVITSLSRLMLISFSDRARSVVVVVVCVGGWGGYFRNRGNIF